MLKPFSRKPNDECLPKAIAEDILYRVAQDEVIAESLCYDFIEDYLIKYFKSEDFEGFAKSISESEILNWINLRRNPAPTLAASLISGRLNEIPSWYLKFLATGYAVFPSHVEKLKPGELRDVVYLQSASDKITNVDITGNFYDFNWGYSGVGPFQFAENILSHFLKQDQEFISTWKIDFVIDFVSQIPTMGGRIPAARLLDWIKEKRSGKYIPYRERNEANRPSKNKARRLYLVPREDGV